VKIKITEPRMNPSTLDNSAAHRWLCDIERKIDLAMKENKQDRKNIMRENSPMFLLECDLEGTGDWTVLCGHKTLEQAESCMKYFQPMAAFSGKPMRIRADEKSAIERYKDAAQGL